MWNDAWEDAVGFLKFMVVALVLVGGVILPLAYQSCKVTAKVVNEEFGTSYTASDIFWAGETIGEVVLGQKARIDLDVERQ